MAMHLVGLRPHCAISRCILSSIRVCMGSWSTSVALTFIRMPVRHLYRLARRYVPVGASCWLHVRVVVLLGLHSGGRRSRRLLLLLPTRARSSCGRHALNAEHDLLNAIVPVLLILLLQQHRNVKTLRAFASCTQLCTTVLAMAMVRCTGMVEGTCHVSSGHVIRVQQATHSSIRLRVHFFLDLTEPLRNVMSEGGLLQMRRLEVPNPAVLRK